MAYYQYQDSNYPVRQDLADAYRQYWQELAQPGNWFSGAERYRQATGKACAEEVRQQRGVKTGRLIVYLHQLIDINFAPGGTVYGPLIAVVKQR